MKPKLNMLVPAALLWAAPFATAQETETTLETPLAEEAPEHSGLVDAPEYDAIHQRTLSNGLTVLVVEDHDVPIVTIELAGRNGAFTEEPEFNGLSHLYEHMFFKANENLPNQEAFMARRRELGASGWNGTTGKERVNYYFTVPTDNVEEGVEFMSDAIRGPLFLEEELERERVVVLGEYDRNEADPFYYLWDTMSDLLWYRYPTRKDSLGDRETIISATPEQMRWMQETYYVPNNMLLILAGDIRAEDGFELAEEYFGDWEQGEDPSLTYPIPEHPPLRGNVAAVVEQPVNASFITTGWHGPDTRDDVEATYAADVFSFILSQEGSAFTQNLVDSGIALGASLSYSTLRYVGPIYLTVYVAPGNEEAAINAINEELPKFIEDNYFSDEQLETAKTLLAVDDLHSQQSANNLARSLSYWWCSASVDYYLTYIENLNAVTREDIHEYVEEYILGENRATVLMTNADVISAGGWTSDRVLEVVEGTGAEGDDQ